MNDVYEQLTDDVLHGNRRSAARLISAVERGEAGLSPHLSRLWKAGGKAQIVGITGPPGAGKSTLVDCLISQYRAQRLRVAVLAVDPSGMRGGAVLGDRIRMLSHANDRQVFIRSMSARGVRGGLAAAAGDALTILDAMGVDRILVETVGVGQSEIEIANYCPCVLLLQTAAGGDAIQAIKAGIIEIASVFVLSKPSIGDVAAAVRNLQEAAVFCHINDPDGWLPPVLPADAVSGIGMEELVSAIEARFAWLDAHPIQAGEEEEARIALRALSILRNRFECALSVAHQRDADIAALVDAVRRRRSGPAELVDYLIAST